MTSMLFGILVHTETSAGKTAWMLCQEFGGAEESGGRGWGHSAPTGR